MVNYDGADIIKTYLNGLPWTALTKPTFYESWERQDSVYPNAIIIEEESIEFDLTSHDTVRWTHGVSMTFTATTKVLSYTNLEYVVQNIFNYSNAVNAMEINTATISYSRKRKTFILSINITELKTI